MFCEMGTSCIIQQLDRSSLSKQSQKCKMDLDDFFIVLEGKNLSLQDGSRFF